MTKKGKKKSSMELVPATEVKNKDDFLPLEGGGATKDLQKEQPSLDNRSTVLYIGRIPHGFYEDEMRGFFKQFGTIKRLRIARNRKTGRSKHYGFIEFEYPEVAKIVAESMHNYLLFEHMLQVQLVPPERVHPKLWRGANVKFNPVDFVGIERARQNKERTLEEHKKLVDRILHRGKKRQKKIEAAGIEYECPNIVGADQPLLKKTKHA
ncbi:hypothetical protein Droror1_Dr00002733 [Drosera rotundifolia]